MSSFKILATISYICLILHKVPQIQKIQSNLSVEGINPMMYYLEIWFSIIMACVCNHDGLGMHVYSE